MNAYALIYVACWDNVASVTGKPNHAFYEVDVRNREGLDAVFDQPSPDTVMHLAQRAI